MISILFFSFHFNSYRRRNDDPGCSTAPDLLNNNNTLLPPKRSGMLHSIPTFFDSTRVATHPHTYHPIHGRGIAAGVVGWLVGPPLVS